jgi:hypothetical protein
MKVRLALRQEDAFWNAYLAHAGTMENAKLIGSIVMGAVQTNPEIKAAFMALMQQVVAHGIQGVTGKLPDEWEVGPAPESERAGHS